MRNRSTARFLTWITAFAFLLTAGCAVAAELPVFTELAANNGPAVVNISTTQKGKQPALPGMDMPDNIPGMPEGPWSDLFRHFFDGERGQPEREFEARSLGSGFIIDSDGHIITNNHVVEGADEIIVRLSDRRELVAEVVGSDPRSDIALLKVDAEDLPVVEFGSADELKVGEWVMAIGSPFGFDHSVSVGVVSAMGRSLPSESYVPFIQTDVAINPGNSGGPLFNVDGKVVGVNSQIYSRTGGFMGLSFAIPIEVAMNVVKQLKEHGQVTRGWLGVLIQDVTRDLAESFDMERPVGALVAKVLEDSPAEKAGFQPGDVVLEFNGQPLERSSDLPPLVGSTRVGDTVTAKVLREGRERKLKVTIGELPAEGDLKPAAPGADAQTDKLGLIVTEPTPEQRERLSLSKDQGVLVESVQAGAARDAGILRGDVIVRIGGDEVTDPEQFRRLVEGIPAGKSVPVLVQRNGGALFLALRVPEK
ncbi:DegQ family serine endoprotease [Thiohalomonas denitrificans]|uniref:Probable periplasmic serine endoprotease DegP-like n=1 Tax=Thiohalomonas denitrificans TaxID=415747 RepID=A0A1G5QD13_9GAMM|nr:DegQ family serine endoprotease [Thiohalomonas denitrificans]SCZ59528.1 serine protease Do [Thiohalomonas denitrificans]